MMLRTRLTKCSLALAIVASGALAAGAAIRSVEVLPTPEVVHAHGPHVAVGACCVDLCGHCGPAAHHKYRLSARRALKCEGPIEVCMHVIDPACCGCPVEIPMCIPACCVEPPVVSADRGLFGRGVVCLEWPCCGYSARVVFKHHGKIDVIYTAR
jgi:hypothetical protein